MRPYLRSFAVAVFALGVCVALFAEDTLEQKRDQKLKSEYFKKAPWTTDYDQARASAKKSGKLIFVFFNRSYEP